MKVVHISTYVSSGGAAIAAFRLHRALIGRLDIESSVLQKFTEDREFMSKNNVYLAEKDKSFISRLQRKLKLDTESRHSKLEATEIFRNSEYEIVSFPTSSYRLDRHPLVKDADIIHLHWVADNFLDYPSFFKNVKQPIVWTLHDINPFRGIFHFDGDRSKNLFLKRIDESAYNLKAKSIKANRNINIVCLSEWMKNKSQNSGVFDRYKHHIIPNGLDFSLYPQLDKTQARISTNTNNGLKTILVVGASLDSDQKGFYMLFDVLNKLGCRKFNLVTIGHTDNKDFIKKNINHLHINKTSNVSMLNLYYAAADITIIPSREDNLPNVMLESFANGTPIMSFSNGGMAEHIKSGENGILIDEINSEALALEINNFISGKYNFNRDNIRKYAIAHFSDQIQTQRYIDLYKSILDNK